MSGERGTVLVALGGNAISAPGSAADVREQVANVGSAMVHVADAVTAGWHVVLTHGNGPQVGDLVDRDELNAPVAPPYPLDWAVAETQATIGHVIADALGVELAERGAPRSVAAVVSRVLVAADDPGFDEPTKPIGPYVPDEEARRRDIVGRPGWTLVEGKGWRRVVASPAPLESLELTAVRTLVDAGVLVIANGGGGIPTVRGEDGRLRGVPAVVDKDLAGGILAGELDVDRYVILTDVPAVAVGWGTDDERWLDHVAVSELRRHQQAGAFPAGSMGPKVEAACRFVEGSGRRAAIGALDDLTAVLAGDAGTQITPR